MLFPSSLLSYIVCSLRFSQLKGLFWGGCQGIKKSIPGHTLFYLTYLQSCLRNFMAKEKQALEILPSVRKRLWFSCIDIHIAPLSQGATPNPEDKMWNQALSMRIAQTQICPHIRCSDFFFEKKMNWFIVSVCLLWLGIICLNLF